MDLADLPPVRLLLISHGGLSGGKRENYQYSSVLYHVQQ